MKKWRMVAYVLSDDEEGAKMTGKDDDLLLVVGLRSHVP
jgi:hypothetical protein